MKILFLSDDFPPKSFGGAGIITFNLAKGLLDAGHKMYAITTTQDRKEEGWSNVEGIEVYNLYVDYDGRFAAYVSLCNPKVILKVKKLIKDINPEVIHAHNIHHYLSYYTLAVARSFTSKVFLTTHDAMSFNYGKLVNFYDRKNLEVQKDFSYKVGFLQNLRTAKKRYNPIRNIAIRWYLNTFPKKIFAISHELKKALNQNGIKNVETIHYGIESRDWNVSEEEKKTFSTKLGLDTKKIVFFGGRLSEFKGGKIMIDTMKELSEKDRDIVLLIAGTLNDYSKYLLNYAEEIGVMNNIFFTGWLSRDDMKKAYAVCDVCVTPSIYFDAFNLFNIEAGSASKPVVGTCFGGTPEIVIDKVTGLIVNPNNIEILSNAIYTIVEDKEYTTKLGKAGNERVKEYFTMDRYVIETLSWYQK